MMKGSELMNKSIVGKYTLALLVALVALADVASAAEIKKVRATGQAAIYQNDLSAARDKALDDARRKAVEQAVGAVISSSTLTENFELLEDKIFSQAAGYVRSYVVVDESRDADGIYSVTIDCEVSAGKIDTDLAAIQNLLAQKQMPRVLVMVSEQNVGQTEGGWWSKTGAAISLDVVDNTIFSIWSAKGVKFVDRQVLEGKIRAGAAASGDIGNDIAKEFGSLCGADIVIVGRAIASDIGNTYPGSKLRTLQANTSIRAINVNNAEMLAAVTTTKSASHLNAVTGGTKALELVAKSAAEQLLTQVLDRWSKDVGGAAALNLTFNGVKKSKQLRLLKTFLTNEIRGVENVIQRSFKKGKALFEVKYKGSMQQLVEELEEKVFPGFAMSLEEMNSDAATMLMEAQ
ncbi:MAG: flagellar assembly protein T N-terminal domain-containing protein [Myxococcota bacterium]|nr:flagellar assembly protein T N-terminal domain-containing protein [Myxococcota bacterium]